jgi:hypothetical protein
LVHGERPRCRVRSCRQVGILSYDGRVHFAFTLDDETTAEAREMLPRFYVEEVYPINPSTGPSRAAAVLTVGVVPTDC